MRLHLKVIVVPALQRQSFWYVALNICYSPPEPDTKQPQGQGCISTQRQPDAVLVVVVPGSKQRQSFENVAIKICYSPEHDTQLTH
jgi:hypothetical protein